MSRKSVHSYNPGNLVCGRLRQHHIHIGLVPSHRALPLPPASGKDQIDQGLEVPPIESADHLRCQITLAPDQGFRLGTERIDVASNARLQ